MSVSSSPEPVRVCVDEVGHEKWWSKALRKAAMIAVVATVVVSITSVLDPRDGWVRWLFSILFCVLATFAAPRAVRWLWRLRQGRAAFVLPPVSRWPAILGWFALAALLFLLPAMIGMAIAAFLTLEGGKAGLALVVPLLVFVGKPLFSASDRATHRVRRFASVRARDLMQADRRFPVLLLRSFADDNRRMDTSVSPRWGGNDAKTFEEVITERLRPFGPVVAIGRPGEQVPAAGAAREYLTDSTWQERVEELVGQALAIVVVAGNTPGLRWELQRIESMGAMRKLLIVVPGDDTGESGTILAALANTVGGTRIGAVILDHVHEDAAVVFLGSDQVLEFASSRRTAREFGVAVDLGMRKLLEARRTLDGAR